MLLLQDILPSCFEYVVTYFDLKEDGGFSTIVRTNVDDKDGALRWIDMFQETSLNDLRSHNTFKENSPRIIFKVSSSICSALPMNFSNMNEVY